MITDNFIIDLLNALKLTPTKNRANFLRAWSASENTTAANNPLATTWDMSSLGATPYNNNKPPVQNYPSQEIGVRATAQTLQQASFKPLLDALKSDQYFDSVYNNAIDSNLNLWGTGGKLVKDTFAIYKNKPFDPGSADVKKKVPQGPTT